MKKFYLVFILLATSCWAHEASAAGCLKGAAAGAVVGHYAGHHALLGAAVGCAIGHHAAAKKAREARLQHKTHSSL